jgi:hypothetical protein
MWLFDRVRPVTSGNDRLVGRGSRPTPASCCAQREIVEYWRGDALGQQSEFTPLVTTRRSDGPMKAQDPGPWRKIDVILPRHDLRERDHQR